MELTHWKKLENPDYIGSYAFQPGETKIVTIQKVTRELVVGPDGKKEQCTIVHFAENEKPLILNRTNGKMITKLTGSPYVEQWRGHKIMLGVESVKAFGEVVDAVRVKKTKPAQETATVPDCADCGKQITDANGVSAIRIATGTAKTYGVALCFACANKRKEAAQNAKNDHVEGKEVAANEDDQNQDQ